MHYTSGDYYSCTVWVSQCKKFGVDSPQILSEARKMVYCTGEAPVCDSLAQLILFWESKAEGEWDLRHISLVSFFLGVVFVAHCSVCCCFESHSEERCRECRQLMRGCGLHFRSRCQLLQSQAPQCLVSHCACVLLHNTSLHF